MTALLQCENVGKRFGAQTIFQGVTFSVSGGDFVVLRGANGSGKTTLLSSLCGLCSQTEGSVRLFGETLRRGREGLKLLQKVGIAFREAMLYSELTVAENLTLFAQLRGVAPDSWKEIAERFSLQSYFDRQISECSDGTIQRVAIVRAFLGSPQVLVLDEPFTHLDELSQRTLFETLQQFCENGGAVICSSHEAWLVADARVKKWDLNGGQLRLGGNE